MGNAKHRAGRFAAVAPVLWVLAAPGIARAGGPPGLAPAPKPAPGGAITLVRADLGVNAPPGVFGLTLGEVFGQRFAVEASAGLGGGANFLVASGRYFVGYTPSGWQWGLGLGGSLGFNKKSCCIEGEMPPDSPSLWLHQELSLSRVASHSLTLLLAAGVEELMVGEYHVDVTDVNFVDRKAISAQPYLRAGLGWGF